MKSIIDPFIEEASLDAAAQAQLRGRIMARTYAAKKADARLKKKVTRAIKKRAVYQACLKGIEKAEMIAATQRDLIAATERMVSGREDEVKEKLSALQTCRERLESELKNDWRFMDEWLNFQENLAIIELWKASETDG
jgi:FKBP-type peptidyl-prolyl cis-trans isomerase (trigger factor)